MRHARRRARPRRGARNGGRRSDRHRVRRPRGDGRRAVRACARSIGGACAIAPSNASAPSAWSTNTWPCTGASWRRIVDDAHADMPRLPAARSSPCSPTRRRVARLRRHARPAGRRRRARRAAVRVARRKRIGQRRVPAGQAATSGASARTNCARPRARSASPTCSSAITPTATCAGPTCPSCTTRSSRPSGAIGPTASSPSRKTGCTGTSITSAFTSEPTPPCDRSAPTRRRCTT